MTKNECYEILEITGDDLKDDYLKKAKRKALKKWHPDVATHQGISLKDAHERTIKINEAFDYLVVTNNWLRDLNSNQSSSKKYDFKQNTQRNSTENSGSKNRKTKKDDSKPTTRYERDGKMFFEECHVDWIKYILNEKVLIVKFESKPQSSESIYLYENVPIKTYEDYVRSHDAGKFQYHNVSYSFKYRRIISEFDWSNFKE